MVRMNAHPHNVRCTCLIAGTLLATISSGVLPRVASSQQMTGSLGVSLTVLAPVGPPQVRIMSLGIDPDGMATLHATVPTRSGASRLVITRASSSADGFVSVRLLPLDVRRTSAAPLATREVAYRIEVGPSSNGDARRDVQLRLEYLMVAGT
jgi:hypothetical protein